MEPREVHGRAAPSSLQESFRPVLIDTTQLALERTISGAAQRHEALAANLANATTPATSAWTWTSTARWPPRSAPTTPARGRVHRVHDAGRPRRRRHEGRRRLDRRRRGVGQARRQRARAAGRRRRRQDPQRDPALRHGCRLMSMFGGLEISASALTAQRLRMNVTAENLANAETTTAPTEAVPPQGGLRCRPSRRRLRRPAEQGDGRRRASRPAASRPRPSPRTRRTASSSTTPATPTPTSRATCACRTSTRSPRWST